jgi:hypothetical protein
MRERSKNVLKNPFEFTFIGKHCLCRKGPICYGGGTSLWLLDHAWYEIVLEGLFRDASQLLV